MTKISLDEAYAQEAQPRTLSLDDAYKADADAQYAEDVQRQKDVLRTLAQGATFGFSDEIVGAARAGWEKLTGGKRTYAELRDEERAALEKYAEKNPWLAKSIEIAGGFMVPGLGAARVMKSVNKATGSRAIAGSAVGAPMGAAYGAGTAKELEDIPGDAAGHMAIAAAGGAILTKAGDAAVAGGRWVWDGAAKVFRFFGDNGSKVLPWNASAQRFAERASVEQLEQAGIHGARDFDVAHLNAMQDAPMVPAVAVDVGGDRATRLAHEVLPHAGPGSVDAAKSLHELQGRQAIAPMSRFLDAQIGIASQERNAIALNSRDKRHADLVYSRIQDVLENTQVTAPEVRALIEAKPHIAGAWDDTATMFANRDKGWRLSEGEKALQEPDPGKFFAGPSGQLIPVMRDVEVPLVLLDDALKASTGRMQGMAREGSATHTADEAHKALGRAVAAVEQRSGTNLTKTRAEYAGKMSRIDARSSGMSAFGAQEGQKLHEFMQSYDKMTPDLQRDFAVGYADALRRAIINAGDRGFNVTQLFRSVEHQNLFSRVLRHHDASERVRTLMETMNSRNDRNRQFLDTALNRPITTSVDAAANVAKSATLGAVSKMGGARSFWGDLTNPWTKRRADAMIDLLMTQGGRDKLRDAIAHAETKRNTRVTKRETNDAIRDAMIQALVANPPEAMRP